MEIIYQKKKKKLILNKKSPLEFKSNNMKRIFPMDITLTIAAEVNKNNRPHTS